MTIEGEQKRSFLLSEIDVFQNWNVFEEGINTSETIKQIIEKTELLDLYKFMQQEYYKFCVMSPRKEEMDEKLIENNLLEGNEEFIYLKSFFESWSRLKQYVVKEEIVVVIDSEKPIQDQSLIIQLFLILMEKVAAFYVQKQEQEKTIPV